MTNRDRPATMLTKREHAALAIYLADLDLDAIAAVHLADELFDVIDTPAELRGHEYTVQLPIVEGDGEVSEYKYVRGDIV